MEAVTVRVEMRAYRYIATLLFGGCTAFSSVNSGTDLERELRGVDAARNNALRTGDTTALAQLYADDFVMITSSGQLRTKRDQLRDIASGAVQHQGPSERILRLTMRGDVAIVQGESDAGTLVTGGRADARMRRYTRVYIRHAGRWQLLATHISVVTDSMPGSPRPPNPSNEP